MSEGLKMYIERIQKMELNKLDKMLSNIDSDVSYGYLTCDEGNYLLNRLGFQYKKLNELLIQKGYWVYDEKINNWRCSHCHGIPKIMGYVGTEEFMKENFNYCPWCGVEMENNE